MALALVRSCFIRGVHAHPVHVEVHLGGGLPCVSIVGLPESAVREAKDRLRAALTHLGFGFPQVRVTVNLAPVDVPKRGGRFDLPIALGLLVAMGKLPARAMDGVIAFGELGLGGELRGVPGALPAALAQADGGELLVLPRANLAEASLAPRARLLAGATLHEIHAALRARAGRSSGAGTATAVPPPSPPPDVRSGEPDLADVVGQVAARRAIEIAAAGGHSLLLTGPPGIGKSMLARRLAGLLPPLAEAEALEVASLASVSYGGLDVRHWGRRPFRAPHHTASGVALVGGGMPPMPGEISLAHRGLLFLDELPEFSRRALETLRAPLESGTVTVSRGPRQADFPAVFQLIAAMNPCPCGHFRSGGLEARAGGAGASGPRCTCRPSEISRYLSRLSGPFLERIDIGIVLSREEPAVRSGSGDGPPRGPAPDTDPAPDPVPESSATVRVRTDRAAAAAHGRQGVANARLDAAGLRRHAALEPVLRDVLDEAVTNSGLSMRARERVLRVARTIADLDGAGVIGGDHLLEAMQIRPDIGAIGRSAPA